MVLSTSHFVRPVVAASPIRTRSMSAVYMDVVHAARNQIGRLARILLLADFRRLGCPKSLSTELPVVLS